MPSLVRKVTRFNMHLIARDLTCIWRHYSWVFPACLIGIGQFKLKWTSRIQGNDHYIHTLIIYWWVSQVSLEHGVAFNSTLSDYIFSALYRKQGLGQKLFNLEPITRLARCMEKRLELNVTWQNTKTGQTCSSKTSAAPTMNSSAPIVWLLAPPFTKAW